MRGKKVIRAFIGEKGSDAGNECKYAMPVSVRKKVRSGREELMTWETSSYDPCNHADKNSTQDPLMDVSW